MAARIPWYRWLSFQLPPPIASSPLWVIRFLNKVSDWVIFLLSSVYLPLPYNRSRWLGCSWPNLKEGRQDSMLSKCIQAYSPGDLGRATSFKSWTEVGQIMMSIVTARAWKSVEMGWGFVNLLRWNEVTCGDVNWQLNSANWVLILAFWPCDLTRLKWLSLPELVISL